MKKNTGFYPRVQVDTAPVPAVAQAGGVTLTETIAVSGLGAGLQATLSPWRRQYAVHDPAKVLLDLALTLALGGEHLADVAVIRAEPALHGLVASDPTISRTIDALATDADAVLNAIDGALSVPARRPVHGPGRWPARTPPTTVRMRSSR